MFLAVVGLYSAGEWAQGRYWWLPGDIKHFASHVLWAAGCFCLLAMLRPHWSTRALALVTMAIVWGLEFSQLYQARWIDVLRNQPWSKFLMIAGKFGLNDLVALAAGIVIASGMDVTIRPVKGKKR